MTIEGDAEDGLVRYAWQESDWDTENGDGFLIVSPDWTKPGAAWHRMEYEVVGGSSRLTFPPSGFSPEKAYDELRIYQDIGQGDE